MTPRYASILMATAAVLIAMATGLGAYASHGLDSVLDASSLRSFETAINYQFFHSLGLIGVCAYTQRGQFGRLLPVAASLIVAGIVLFCGGVYASSLDGPGWISGLAPTGGMGLIAGWLLVAFVILTRRAGA